MTNNQKNDYALEYTTKIALFLCSQNMALKDIYQACNLNDTPGENNREKFLKKFPLFPDSNAPKPSTKELFFAETRTVKNDHAEQEGIDLFMMTLLTLSVIVCIALIVVAPYAAAAIAGAIAISELRKPLMIYYIAEGAVGLARTLGLAATVQFDRADRNEALLNAYTQYSKVTFNSVDDLKNACKECHLDDTIQAIYDHLRKLPDATTEATDFLSQGKAEREHANKLMGKFASHHQGLFGWFTPWLTSTEAKGGPTVKRKYAQDIEKVFSSLSSVSTNNTAPISTRDITVSEATKPSHNRTNDRNQLRDEVKKRKGQYS